MNISLTWKAILAIVLGGALAFAVVKHEAVAVALASHFATILTALGV